jgi:hypothetical protein
MPNKAGIEAKRLSAALHSFQAKNEVFQYESEDQEESPTTKDKHKKKSKPVYLQQRKQFDSKAVFCSPNTIRKSCVRKAVRQCRADES